MIHKETGPEAYERIRHEQAGKPTRRKTARAMKPREATPAELVHQLSVARTVEEKSVAEFALQQAKKNLEEHLLLTVGNPVERLRAARKLQTVVAAISAAK